MKGWIKDYRQELNGDIWSMPPLYHRIWQYLKYKANYEETIIPMRDGTKLKVFPGQHLTSLRNIAQGVAWYERGVLREPNVKTVSAVLDWLEKEGMITIDTGNRKYTAISLVKWDIYQGDDDSKVTVDGLESKHSLDTKKKEKNYKNDKNIKKKDNNTFSAYTSNTDLLKALESFVEFRKKIKKPMTDRAIELLLNKLDKLASDDDEKIAVLEQSILNGWQGLFPLKNKGGETNATDRESVADPYASIDFGF